MKVSYPKIFSVGLRALTAQRWTAPFIRRFFTPSRSTAHAAAAQAPLAVIDEAHDLPAETTPADAPTRRHHPILIQRAALNGLPVPSSDWQAFESWDDLCAHALHAPTASLLLTLTDAAGTEPLAAQLHTLQRACRSRLKIVIRVSPAIGEYQRRLLTACGATLLLPQDMPIGWVCETLAVITTQPWQITVLTENFEALVQRLQPPALRGIVDPAEFRASVAQVFSRSDAASHTTLRLRPRGVLTPAMCLQQMRFERDGMFACATSRDVYLFLFERTSDLTTASLLNICRLPWPDLFAEMRQLNGLQDLPPREFRRLNATDTPEQATASPSGSRAPTDLVASSTLRPLSMKDRGRNDHAQYARSIVSPLNLDAAR